MFQGDVPSSTEQALTNVPSPLTEAAETVLRKRYYKPGEDFAGLCRRVAKAVAQAHDPAERDAAEAEYFDLMYSLKFLPNSPTLMNAGKDNGLGLSACYVLPVEDSIEGIFEAIKQAALVHKGGGGTGFSFSRLRPANSTVKSTMGVSSGPLSFMRVFNAATETIKQGSTRRGANMGILRVDHPDVMDFIRAKSVEGDLANFNLSVGITNAFMEALKAGEAYPLVSPHNNEVVEHASAGAVFQEIVDHAWKNGEPGIVFIDRMNEGNTTPHLGEIEATNP
jgi:ribonucleoside-diphosphate reductase alpha chain